MSILKLPIVQKASLPPGWKGSPQEFQDTIPQNFECQFEGEIPKGVVGGPMPTQDSGIYYGDDGIYVWTNGRYDPITDVPVGTILPYAPLAINIPANYLLCDGSLKLKSEFPRLWNTLGTAYNLTTDTDQTRFRLPNMAGRTLMGAGTADFALNTYPSNAIQPTTTAQAIGPASGKSPVRTAGQYLGFTSPVRVGPWADMPDFSVVTGSPNAGGWTSNTYRLDVTPPCLVLQMIIRAK